MTLENLISRADEDTMQDLLGRDTIRLIRLLNRKDSISTKTKEALIKLHTFEGLLLIKEKRALLFNLLKKPELKKICEALSIPYNELSYEIIQSLHIRRGSVKEKALFDCFGLTPPLKDGITEIPDCENINASYALFTHQIDAAQKVESKLNDYHRRVILHMPTGSGKTRTAMYVIAQHLLKKEGTIVVWLAYSEELCEQAADEFKKAWQSLGNRDLRLHRFWGDHQLNLEKVNDGVLIAGLSKTYSAIRKNITTIKTLASKCSLVIIDEAHQAIAETYSLVLSALFSYNKNTGLLGLTATPGRTSWNMTDDKVLSSFFCKQKVILDIEGYPNPIEYLIQEKYIAKTNFKTLAHEGCSKFNQTDLQNRFEIPYNILITLAEDELRNLKILSAVEDLTKRHTRIIVFAINVKHAEMLAAVLQARGFSAKSITAVTPSNKRAQLIEDFKNSDSSVKLLCNYGVLTTGFDAPKTSAAVIARPTKSLVLYSQMVGRVTRGLKAGGNKIAEVITVADMNLHGFRDMVEAFNNWEDVWK